MKKIIALKGKGNVGKTTTIRILHNILQQNGYVLNETNITAYGGDFVAIFEKNSILIGLTSFGDTYDAVHSRLEELIAKNCEICICASRTYDRVPPGTIGAIKGFKNYSNEFIDKTVDYNLSTQNNTNNNDADRLFQLIEKLV